MWAFMIAGILGLNIIDWYVKGKSDKPNEPKP